jgi:hypothetical protein
MTPDEEKEWIELMNVIHDSVKGGMKYNTGTLLMVLTRPVASSMELIAAGVDKVVVSKGKTPSKDSTRNP